MDAWKDVSTSSQHAVYLGQWTNWSRGPLLGTTLTLTNRDGNLVIAFAAFFVTLVASRVWRIICLCCHQACSSSESQVAPYHQRQIILRNSPSPQSALWKLSQLEWVSRSSSIREVGRTIVPISLALLCLGGFAGVTYILPTLSASTGNEVLLLPRKCGSVNFTEIAYNVTEFYELLQPLLANQITNAANYAQQCYSNSTGTLGCTGFTKDRIPSIVQFNAECPFHETVCRSKTSNLFLDTGYINSHNFFGLNSPLENRVLYRKTLQCAPLVTKGYTSTWRSSTANYTRYHHGSFIIVEASNSSLSNGLYMIEDVASQYRTSFDLRGTPYPIPNRNYLVDAFASIIQNGSASVDAEYVPSPKLRRDDGDSFIIFLSGNGVYFQEPSTDDWYKATKLFEGNTSLSISPSEFDSFIFDEPASPLGCVQQTQFCYEGLPKGKRCGPLASFYDSMSAALEMSPSQTASAQLNWIATQVDSGWISNIIKTLGARALTSQRDLVLGLQGPIAKNQWQLDVVYWWATTLAFVQGNFIDGVVGPSDRRLDKYIVPPEDAQICSNQKIRTTAFTSFNVFGLYFLFLSGALLIAFSFSIEPIISCLHAKQRYNQYKYLEWVTGESLQLHRLAHEGVGWGTWARAIEDIPTTEKGQALGCLDLTEPLHPRLCSPISHLSDDVDIEHFSESGCQTPSRETRRPPYLVASRTLNPPSRPRYQHTNRLAIGEKMPPYCFSHYRN
ncbi:hypothetical protein F5Y10DRAFT_276535 [Nemania abortiva]|nr:hypothetical protein F5Y10DRAFT_276535 [Nemania abortiva]